MTLETLMTFLGWCTLINLLLYATAVLFVTKLKKISMGIHQKLFDLDDAYLTQAYFEFLGRYKQLIIFFNIVPYLVLRLAL